MRVGETALNIRMNLPHLFTLIITLQSLDFLITTLVDVE